MKLFIFTLAVILCGSICALFTFLYCELVKLIYAAADKIKCAYAQYKLKRDADINRDMYDQ